MEHVVWFAVEFVLRSDWTLLALMTLCVCGLCFGSFGARSPRTTVMNKFSNSRGFASFAIVSTKKY